MKPVFALMLFLLPMLCQAQRQNDNWCFGDKGGVRFFPTLTTFTSNMDASETSATLSDRNTGKLLFYTDGLDIWDAQHNVMPNGKGAGFAKQATTKQGAVIVPFINEEDKYYVFTTEFSATPDQVNSGKLGYSVVDMRLNNGLGAVVSTQRLIEIDTGFSEGMTAVNDNCGNIWLLVYRRDANKIYAYKITTAGIASTPVVSNIPNTRLSFGMVSMKISPDRKRACVTAQGFSLGGYTALLDFDVYSGKFSDLKLIGQESSNACEFSPDSKKLYVALGGNVVQYDLSSVHETVIKASATVIYPENHFLAAIQMAPDSNIYFGSQGRYLHRISNCNAKAPNCVVTRNAIDFGSNKVTLALPQAIVLPVKVNPMPITTSRSDTVMCMGEPIIIIAPSGKAAYQWQNGNSSQGYRVRQPGVYWVKSIEPTCEEQIDTIAVEGINIETGLPQEFEICEGDAIQLQIKPQPNGTTYSWSTGATTNAITVSKNGAYTATLSYLQCKLTDTITVSYVPKPLIDLGADTQLCKDTWLALPYAQNHIDGNRYVWSTGSTDSTMTINRPGMYTVQVEGRCGDMVYDTLKVGERNCHLFFPSAFSPNGDGKNDRARLIGDVGNLKDYNLRIYNRWGEVVFYTTDAYAGWDGSYKGKKAEIGVYVYQIQYKDHATKELMKGNLMLVR